MLMIELRCSVCNKICAYLAIGSRIANGAMMTCAKCQRKHEVPDFLSQLFAGKK